MKLIKRLSLVCCVCFLITLCFYYLGKSVKASASEDIFAIIKSPDCLLCDKNQTPLFLLPESYYVKVLDKLDKHYFVEYKNIQGFISIEKVELSKTPKNPYPDDFLFSLKTNEYMYNSPNTSSKSIKINQNQELLYIGSMVGEEIEQFGGNLWYYVQLTGSDAYGYVYSTYTTGISGMHNSTEITGKLVNSYEEIKSLSNLTFTIIIILLCLPMIMIVYFLFIPKQKRYKLD